MMRSEATRRGLLAISSAGLPSSLLLAAQAAPATAPGRFAADFPREDSALAREVVGAAHFDEKKVRELVAARPSLVNAWFDWGFGDWESALGAAAHTGRRSIAEFLIEKGARIDIFAAAMLGMTDVVKALVAAQPGVQRTLGPHAIPLLAHAKAGGPQATETVQFLESLGDAGNGPVVAPFPEERKKWLTGKYSAEGREIGILLSNRGILQIDVPAREGYRSPRNLFHKGGDTFFPSGVPTVGFRFDGAASGPAASLTILSPTGEAVTARRVI